jgi:protein dithiol oxidoreductase (disulfide-forming)
MSANLLRRSLLLASLSITALAAPFSAFSQFQVGRDYIVLPNQPSPIERDGKIEVAEFFHYGCGHCAELEPRLEAWAKKQPPDVRVVKVPTTLRLQGIDAVTMFYTLQAMDALDRLHGKIFDAIHRDGQMLGATKVRDAWLVKNGVDLAKYNSVATSFSMQSRQQRTQQLEKQFSVTAVPTLVVAGKYTVANSINSLAVVDMLIAMERQANAGKAPAKPAAPAAATPAATPAAPTTPAAKK